MLQRIAYHDDIGGLEDNLASCRDLHDIHFWREVLHCLRADREHKLASISSYVEDRSAASNTRSETESCIQAGWHPDGKTRGRISISKAFTCYAPKDH